MYRVFADNSLLYSTTISSLKIFKAIVKLEINKSGSFSFVIYPDHPYYDSINKLKTIVSVYQDSFLLFRGRVLNAEKGFHNELQVSCEGELAFFLDSVYRPFSFTGSISSFLQNLITNHNSQVDAAHQFVLGNVTVTDPNDYIVRSSIDYSNTWDVINKKLVDILGGYLFVRHSGGVSYLDYLSDFSTISNQPIMFGRNLLELKQQQKGEDIITALIPLGAKLQDEEGNDTDERLTVSSENGGLDYIYDPDAVNTYGWIWGTQTWDDVTVASHLLTKGRAYLATARQVDDTIELTAADLSSIDQNFDSFHLGTYVSVDSSPHDINQNLLVSSLSIDLLNPTNNKLSLNGILESFTGQQTNAKKDQDYILEQIASAEKNLQDAIYQTVKNNQTLINQTEENIYAKVSEQYYLKDETDQLISDVSTEFTQTKDSFELQFNTFSANLSDLASGTDAEFSAMKKYIRFIDGKIYLGEVGNALELRIANDRISFLQNNAEVAYFSNNKLYVTDGEYTNSLRIGNFAFIPRVNGNLSFKKIN